MTNPAETLLQRVLTFARGEGHENENRPAHIALGIICERRGDDAAARDHYDRAIADSEASNNHAGLCTALINRSGVLLDLGMLEEARADLARAEAIATVMNSPGHLGLLKVNRARLDAHERPEASSDLIELLEMSKEEFDRAGDRVQSGRIGAMLEDMCRSALEREPASLSYEQRRPILQKLSNLVAARGDRAAALEFAEQSLREAQSRGDAEDLLVSRLQVVHRRVLTEGHDVAKQEATQALSELKALAGRIGEESAATIECELLSALGQCLRRLGEPAEAAESYRTAIDIARRIGRDDSEQLLSGNLALALVDQGRADEALPVLRALVADLRRGEDYALLGQARFNLAYALDHSGERDTARAEAAAAKDLLTMIADPMAEEVERQIAGWT